MSKFLFNPLTGQLDYVEQHFTTGSVPWGGLGGRLRQNNEHLFFFNGTNRFGVGTNTNTTAKQQIKNGTPSDIGLLITGAAGQSVDFFTVENNLGTDIFKINFDGEIDCSAIRSTGNVDCTDLNLLGDAYIVDGQFLYFGDGPDISISESSNNLILDAGAGGFIFESSIQIDTNNTAALRVNKNASGADVFVVNTVTAGAKITGTGLITQQLSMNLVDTMTVNGILVPSYFAINNEDSTGVLAEIEMHRASTTAGTGPIIYAARSKGTQSAQTIVADNDTLLSVIATGHDGTDFGIAAQIAFNIDGTPSATSMPGEIVFSTSPAGTQVPVARLTISPDGTLTGAGITSGADPGHTHTGASLSGIDISSDTNLAVSSPIVLTGDTLSFDATANFNWSGTHKFKQAGGATVTLQTSEATVVDGDVLGRIDFQAPDETGADATAIAASIWAEAAETFDATNNKTDLIFATGGGAAAVETMRLLSADEATSSPAQLLINQTTGLAVWMNFGGAGTGATTFTGDYQAMYSNTLSFHCAFRSFYRSRGTTVGAHTIVNAGDECGRLAWLGSNGTTWANLAQIWGVCDTKSGTTLGGRIVFNTVDAAGTFREAMRIDSDQVFDFRGPMSNSTADPLSESPADWIEIKIAGTTHWLPAYLDPP